MLSKMKSSTNKAKLKIKKACSTVATKVNSGHKSRKQQRVRKCVLDLLQLYDPEKVSTVDDLMSEWKNREMQLLQYLHQEYHLTDVGLTYFKSKYSRLFELPSIYKGTFCRQCIRRSNGEQRLYHRLYKKRVTIYTIQQIKYSINILRKLNHKNILKLYDIFESRTRLVLITDLFDYNKVSLPIALLNKSKQKYLTESIIANLFYQMLTIIDYLHSKQYIHCNLNIDSFIIENWINNDSSSNNNKRRSPSNSIMDTDDDDDDDDSEEVNTNGSKSSDDEKEELKEIEDINNLKEEPILKLIRVDQCIFLPELNNKTDRFNITNPRYAPPEIIKFNKTKISTQSDMYSLGILLYVMLTGMLPKQIPSLTKYGIKEDKQSVDYQLKLDHNKKAWNKLSFHVRDLINKLIQKEPSKRLTIEECHNHPWIRRYKNGYLKYNILWDGYEQELYKYQCIQKLKSGIKKLLLIKDSLGLMDDYVLTNDVRSVINNWSRTFETDYLYHIIVPSHVKELIVDFA